MKSFEPWSAAAIASEMRRQFWRRMSALEPDAPAMLDVAELAVDGAEGDLRARLYTPFAVGAPRGLGLVFFHGGGFVTGDLDSHDMICRRLADAAHARVLSVAYRLAPEHKFPAAPEDCYAALRWAHDHAAEIGFARIAVGGDSAGGALAAVCAQLAKKRAGPPLAAQILLYPLTQFLDMAPSQLPSETGRRIARAAHERVRDLYLEDPADAQDPRCSPLVENDLFGLPPAYVVTAAADPLLDEGRAYADKLAACGVPVALRHYRAHAHGFLNLTALLPSARAALAGAGRWLAEHAGP